MLANQEVFRSVADRFDLSVSTTWEYVQRVVAVLISHVKNYIKWPTNINSTSEAFKRRAGIGEVVGAIDGTHIPISTPTYMPNSYLNRNRYHSIILQGVCDANYVFTDCFAGCPGSIHDARVYKMSPLFRNISDLIDGDHHLLGDSAYPNSINLITPYKDNGRLTRREKTFNYHHSSTRVCIEQAFGLLKGRFRILKFINVYRTEIISCIIIACCILHNICLHNDDTIEPDTEISVNEESQGFEECYVNCSKRDSICNYLVS